MHFTLLNNYFAKMYEHSENAVTYYGEPVVRELDLPRMTVWKLYRLIRDLQFYANEIYKLMENARAIISHPSVSVVNNVETTANMFKAQIAVIVQALNEAIALIIEAFTPHHILVPVGSLIVKGNIELWLQRINSTKHKFEDLLNANVDAVLQNTLKIKEI